MMEDDDVIYRHTSSREMEDFDSSEESNSATEGSSSPFSPEMDEDLDSSDETMPNSTDDSSSSPSSATESEDLDSSDEETTAHYTDGSLSPTSATESEDCDSSDEDTMAHYTDGSLSPTSATESEDCDSSDEDTDTTSNYTDEGSSSPFRPTDMDSEDTMSSNYTDGPSSPSSPTAQDNHESIKQFFIEHDRVTSTIPVEDVPALNSCSINSILRPYQRDTVKWMITRELSTASIQIGTHSISLPRGGILADEMGLGKTVEMLACILGNARRNGDLQRSPSKEDCRSPPRAEAEAESSCTSLGKRPAKTVPTFLAKKPRVDKLQQNRTFREEIKLSLCEFYHMFQRTRRMKQKIESLNEVCREIMMSVFNVLLVHLYYNKASSAYAQQQAWAFLVMDFDAHLESSLAYSILARVSEDFENFPEYNAVSDENAQSVITLVQDFLNDRMTKIIVKEFDRVLMSGGELGQNVQCRCGSDKDEGDNVTCTKCEKQQHLKCVGLSRVPANGENYSCPSCWMNETPIKSAATLMVIPDTLTQQWTDEIKKHAFDCDLKICWYRGVSKGYILPTALSEYDIVLITTANLAADLNFVNPQSRTLRHVKRYQPFVTPLTCIQWWRLCIDEAQSIEGVNKVSEMAARLQTEHLWAITGTPISNSLRDLYGLAVYLRIEPFVESDALWSELISGDQSKLHLLFAHLMRRKTKVQVRDQLGLPPITYNVRWLSFPPVEGYHYDATQTSSREKFWRALMKQKVPNIEWNQPLKTANKVFVKSLLAPFRALRQACVNPVHCSLNVFNCGKVESYESLSEKMVKKTKADCENLLRLYVMFVNGGARTHMSANEIVEAVTLYRSVLKEFASHADLMPDDFQYIHIMHQMLEAVRLDSTVQLTDEEKQFPSKMAEIEANCVKKFQDEIDSMKSQKSKVLTDVENYMQTYELKEFSWWDQILSTLDFKVVTKRITFNLERDNIKLNAAMQFTMSSANRLGAAIESWLQDIERTRGLILELLEVIMNLDSRNSLAMEAVNCHNKGIGEKKRTCAVCRTEELMLKYEALLFSAAGKSASGGTVFTETNWKHTALERVLIVLLACSRSTSDSVVNHAAAGQQLKALSGLRREFKGIRAIWSRQSDLLNVCEEIITAKSRMDDDVPIQSGDVQYMNQMNAYVINSPKAYSDLQQKYGSLQYLKNLDRRHKSGEQEEETCPICLSSLHDQRAVLTCGHFTCHDCMESMKKNGGGVNLSINCPICRSQNLTSTISYVRGGGKSDLSDLDVANVVGIHPVKILAITATVLRLIQEDTEVKILVFSTWVEILDSIENAFDKNKISSRKFTTGEERETSLSEFKTRNDVNVLLMPLKSGSKGLNLTEASHIIFAEPVLNTADEEQAVGRIHRMGQERPMTVHKFIMKGSVEEKIHKMNEEFLQGSDSEESQLKLSHLRDLFETSAMIWTETET